MPSIMAAGGRRRAWIRATRAKRGVEMQSFSKILHQPPWLGVPALLRAGLTPSGGGGHSGPPIQWVGRVTPSLRATLLIVASSILNACGGGSDAPPVTHFSVTAADSVVLAGAPLGVTVTA